MHIPGTGIVDYGVVAGKYAEIIRSKGGQVLTDCEVRTIKRSSRGIILETKRGAVEAAWAVNCAGLHSDRIVRLAGDDSGLTIIPFRGEYYELLPEKEGLVNNLIYPVADPRFPFLGVHFTRRIHAGVEVGPNAVLAFKREGYRKTDFNMRDTFEAISFPGFWRMASKYWSSGMAEYYRSLNKRAFTTALQKLVPEVQASDLKPGGAGVRAQAVDSRRAPVGRFFHHSIGANDPCLQCSFTSGNGVSGDRETSDRNGCGSIFNSQRHRMANSLASGVEELSQYGLRTCYGERCIASSMN